MGTSISKLVNRIDLHASLDKEQSIYFDDICLDEERHRGFTPKGVSLVYQDRTDLEGFSGGGPVVFLWWLLSLWQAFSQVGP